MKRGEVTQELKENLAIEQRYSAAAEWVTAASAVAEETDNKTARELIDFISKQAALGVPMEDGALGCYFVGGPPELPIDKYTFLTPVIENDANRLAPDDERLSFILDNPGVIARFNEGSRAIYLPSRELSQVSKGVLLLHEATHAWLDIEGLIDRNYPDGEWLEEADVYEFEFELLQALGGETYQRTLERLLASIRPVGNSGAISTHNDLTPEEQNEFADALGITEEHEIKLFIGVCSFNAFYEYFSSHDPNPRHEFAMFLKQQYPDV